MRRFFLLLTATSALGALIIGHPAKADPFIASSAYGLSVDLTFNGVSTQYGPIGQVAGTAPPPYDQSATIPQINDTLFLAPGTLTNPILRTSAADVVTRAASAGFGVDFIGAHAEANLGSIGLVLTNLPPPPLDLLGILGLSLSATNVTSRADFSVLFGPNHTFAVGDASFGALTLGGALIGSTIDFSGDAPANTVLFSSDAVIVTLDRQLVTTLISCTVNQGCTSTPEGITTDAIDIQLHDASLFGGVVSGDIVIGQSFAGLAHENEVPEPGSLLLFCMGLLGVAFARRQPAL